MTMSRMFAAPAALMALPLAGCLSTSKPPIPLARDVDVARMYGGWRIIATIPNSFEKGMVEPYDVYSRRPDGDIREDFYVRRGSFASKKTHFVVHDWVTPGTGGASWRVQIFWPVNLPFKLLYVDPQYRYAMFGEDNRTMGWVYAREDRVPDADYADLMSRFKALGYDASIFRKIVQRPEDIGAPGFWSDKIRR